MQLQTAVKLWEIEPDKAQLFLKQARQLGTMAMKEVCNVTVQIPRNNPPETRSRLWWFVMAYQSLAAFL